MMPRLWGYLNCCLCVLVLCLLAQIACCQGNADDGLQEIAEMVIAGRAREAIDMLNQEIMSTPDPDRKAELWYLTGRAYQQLHNAEKATDCYSKGMSLARSADLAETGQVLLCRLLGEQADLKYGDDYKLAIDNAKTADQAAGIAAIYVNKRYLLHFDKAKAVYRYYTKHRRATSGTGEYLLVMAYVSTCNTNRRFLDGYEAFKEFEKTGNRNKHRTAYVLARAEQELQIGAYDASRKSFDEAMRDKSLSDNVRCRVLLGKAVLSDKTGGRTAARHLYEEALSLARASGNKRVYDSALVGLGVSGQPVHHTHELATKKPRFIPILMIVGSALLVVCAVVLGSRSLARRRNS